MKTKTFDKNKYFTVGKNNFSYIGYDFKKVFTDMSFTIPKKVKLDSRKLEVSMSDKMIMKKWSPEPVTLGDIACYLKTTNHNDWMIFYVKDSKGVLWSVNAYWYGDGWLVDADSVEDPDEWNDGGQVVSRNFGTLTVGNSDPSEITINEVRYKLTKI